MDRAIYGLGGQWSPLNFFFFLGENIIILMSTNFSNFVQ